MGKVEKMTRNATNNETYMQKTITRIEGATKKQRIENTKKN